MFSDKSRLLIYFAVAMVGSVSIVAAGAFSHFNSPTFGGATPDNSSSYGHYSARAATNYMFGNREYWVGCEKGDILFEAPSGATIYERGTPTDEQYMAMDLDDGRLIPPLFYSEMLDGDEVPATINEAFEWSNPDTPWYEAKTEQHYLYLTAMEDWGTPYASQPGSSSAVALQRNLYYYFSAFDNEGSVSYARVTVDADDSSLTSDKFALCPNADDWDKALTDVWLWGECYDVGLSSLEFTETTFTLAGDNSIATGDKPGNFVKSTLSQQGITEQMLQSLVDLYNIHCYKNEEHMLLFGYWANYNTPMVWMEEIDTLGMITSLYMPMSRPTAIKRMSSFDSLVGADAHLFYTGLTDPYLEGATQSITREDFFEGYPDPTTNGYTELTYTETRYDDDHNVKSTVQYEYVRGENVSTEVFDYYLQFSVISAYENSWRQYYFDNGLSLSVPVGSARSVAKFYFMHLGDDGTADWVEYRMPDSYSYKYQKIEFAWQ